MNWIPFGQRDKYFLRTATSHSLIIFFMLPSSFFMLSNLLYTQNSSCGFWYFLPVENYILNLIFKTSRLILLPIELTRLELFGIYNGRWCINYGMSWLVKIFCVQIFIIFSHQLEFEHTHDFCWLWFIFGETRGTI